MWADTPYTSPPSRKTLKEIDDQIEAAKAKGTSKRQTIKSKRQEEVQEETSEQLDILYLWLQLLSTPLEQDMNDKKSG